MSEPENADATRARVLIADNDAGVSTVLSQVLCRVGLAVELVGDGQTALERLRRGGLQLLVCDLDMPNLSGEEVLAALADIPSAPPAVVISGYLDAASNRRLLRLPKVLLTLRKPFDVFAFARLVADLCRGEELTIPAELAGRTQLAPKARAAEA